MPSAPLTFEPKLLYGVLDSVTPRPERANAAPGLSGEALTATGFGREGSDTAGLAPWFSLAAYIPNNVPNRTMI